MSVEQLSVINKKLASKIINTSQETNDNKNTVLNDPSKLSQSNDGSNLSSSKTKENSLILSHCFPTASGWRPPDMEKASKWPYFVRRTRNHVLPIYYEKWSRY